MRSSLKDSFLRTLDKLPVKKGLLMLGLVALIVLATSANAAVDPKETNLFDIPIQYQGDVSAVVVTGPQSFIDKNCGKASKGYYTVGCSISSKRILYMPNPCTFPEMKDPNSYAHLLCHELAHLNGWHHVNE
jgi:hypothetical protein